MSLSAAAKAYALTLILEGEGPYWPEVKNDSLGFPTIGHGHKLLPHEIGKLKTCTQAQATAMLKDEMAEAIAKVQSRWANHLNMGDERLAVLVDMNYNLGSTNKFKKMEAAIIAKDWETAAEELMDSKYAEQVGDRACRNACIMRDGKKYTKDTQDW